MLRRGTVATRDRQVADLARPAEPSDTADSSATSLYEAIGGHAALVAAADGLFGLTATA